MLSSSRLVRLLLLALVTPLLALVGGGAPAVAQVSTLPTAALAPAGQAITGQVFGTNGRPIDGVLVQAFHAEDRDDLSATPVASDITYEANGLAHGAYRLEVEPGEYVVRYSSLPDAERLVATAHYRRGATVSVTAGVDLTLDDVVLHPPAVGQMTGTVVDESGEPWPGIQVAVGRVVSGGWRLIGVTVTDGQGRYAVRGLLPGADYTVGANGQVTDDGEQLNRPIVYMGGAPTPELADSVRLAPGATTLEMEPLELSPGVPVTGRVEAADWLLPDVHLVPFLVDEDDPDGFAQIGGDASVEHDGTWTLPLLEGYEYTIAAFAPDPEGERGGHSMVFLGDTLDMDDARTFTALAPGVAAGTIDLDGDLAEVRLRFRVASTDGTPLSGDEVYAQVLRVRGDRLIHAVPADHRQDGYFVARIAPGHTYTVATYDGQGGTVFLGDTADDADARRVDVAADRRSVDLGTITRATQAPSFAGTVLVDGEVPAVPVRVSLYTFNPGSSYPNWRGATWTRADGSYVLRVPAGVGGGMSIQASLPNTQDGSGWLGGSIGAERLDAPSGRATVEDIELAARPTALAGTVVGPDGEPFTDDLIARLFRRDGWSWQEVSQIELRGPRWGFVGLEPGEYAVTVEANDGERILAGGRGADHTLTVGRPATTSTLHVASGASTVDAGEIRLRRTATVSGVLRKADGSPAANHPNDVKIGFTSAGWSALATAPVDGRGRYTLEGLPAGSYDLQVRGIEIDGRQQFGASVPGIQLAWGDDLVLDPQIATGRRFEGVVRDEDGNPLPGVPVHIYWHGGTSPSDRWLSTTTDDLGRYVMREDSQIAGSWVRVAAEWREGGYDLQVSDRVVEQGDGVDGVVTTDLQLAPADDAVRVAVRAADGAVLDGDLRVELLRDGNGEEIIVDSFDVDGDDEVEHVAFREVAAGDYWIRASFERSGRRVYLPASSATVTVDGSAAVTVPELVLERAAGLAGTVTIGAGEVPLGDAIVGFDYASSGGSGSAWAVTGPDGRYELDAPPGATGTLTVHSGTALLEGTVLEDVVAGAASGEIARQDVTVESNWAGQPGEQLDHCLAQPVAGAIGFGELELDLRYGYLVLAGRNPYDVEPGDLWSRVPYLAALPGDPSGGARWGVSSDGQQLCVQVADWNSYQVLLTRRTDGGYDVVYSYGSIGSYDPSRPAGHDDGLGSFGARAAFPGAEDNGYYAGEPYDLTTRTDLSESGRPGRADFVFHGFDLGDAPVPTGRGVSIEGERRVGATLTARPGVWALDGERLDDVELEYRWLRDGVAVAHGQTHVVEPEDQYADLVLEVDAFVPGHARGRADARARIERGMPVAEVVRRPKLSTTTPAVGDTLRVHPGQWEPAAGLDRSAIRREIQWLVDNQAVGDGPTLLVRPQWAGRRVAAYVRYELRSHAPGYEGVGAGTHGVRVLAGPPVHMVQEPTVTGDPSVGSVLTVTDGAYDATDPTITYTWHSGWRTREPVAGSDGRSYRVTAADRGTLLTLVATAEVPGRKPSTWTTTVGPVAAAGTTYADVAITAIDEATDAPLDGARFRVCTADRATCLPGSAPTDGTWTVALPVGGDFEVVAQRYAFRSGSSDFDVTGDPDSDDVTVQMVPVVNVPAETHLYTAGPDRDGVPSLAVGQEHTIAVTGCASDARSFRVELLDGTEVVSGELTMVWRVGARAGYQAIFWVDDEHTGPARVITDLPLTCDGDPANLEFDVYLDPSGVVTDQYGSALEGVTVTLQRATSPAGPFTAVPNGSSLMSPANRANPDTTDTVGRFRWDVQPGWYRVRATRLGCSPAVTDAMDVPPERIDLLIRLDCVGSPAPMPYGGPEITGTPSVGSTLTVTPGHWSSRLEVTRMWLRDGRPIAGATGLTYVVTAADASHTITVRESGRRPTYVQEAGRGAPVEFDAGRSVSDGVTVPAASSGGGGGGGLPTLTAERPVLTGPGKVGTTLTAPEPAWATDGVTTTREWLRDGKAIDHAGATYDLTPADLGAAVSVRYTGTRSGYAGGTVTSTTVTVVVGDAPTAATAPRLRGSGRVGTTLSVADVAWSAGGVTTTRQWLVDGRPVAAATGPTFALDPSHLGHEISVALTGTLEGYADGVTVTATTSVRLGSRAVAIRKPFVTGKAVLGKVLRVHAGRWDAPGLRFTFQWLRDGKVIRGATREQLRVRPALLGHRLRVVVTASRGGYADGMGSTRVVRVRR